MQAIELVVFFLAAIMIGSLMIIFISGLEPGELFEGIKKMIFPQEYRPDELAKIPFAKFHEYVYQCWQKCETGETFLKCGTVYITDGTSLSSAGLLATFQKYNFCLDCNVDVPNEITLPAVVQVECQQKKIVVTG